MAQAKDSHRRSFPIIGVLTIAIALAGGLLSVASDAGSMKTRISALETNQAQMHEEMKSGQDQVQKILMDIRESVGRIEGRLEKSQ